MAAGSFTVTGSSSFSCATGVTLSTGADYQLCAPRRRWRDRLLHWFFWRCARSGART